MHQIMFNEEREPQHHGLVATESPHTWTTEHAACTCIYTS